MSDLERDPTPEPPSVPTGPAPEQASEPAAPGVEARVPTPARSDAEHETLVVASDPSPAGSASAAATATAATAGIAAPAPRRNPLAMLAERPELVTEIPREQLRTQSRRDFMLFAAGILATAAGAWWLLPDPTKARLLSPGARDRLDTLAGRVGLSRANRDRTLDRVLTFDDDVAEALYSKDRRVRTYARSEVTPLPNNYAGHTPDGGYLPGWRLQLSGLASGRVEQLTIEELVARFATHEQVTRLICVEGWSAVAAWGGIRFAELLQAYPPTLGARWAGLRSAVNLDLQGRPDPYYVSIDLETARHPQTLFATHQGGRPLTLAHGAPMRLLVPMKLGLKNIKAVTEIAYGAAEPADYWNERGYSRYDGL